MADAQGLDAVSLASLARELGVRSPSLYNHVEGLPDLRIQLAVHGYRCLHRAMTEAVVGRAGDDALHRMGDAYLTFAREHPGLYEATFRSDPRDTSVKEAGSPIVDLILQVLEVYDLDEETALHVVRGLRSILHGFTSLEQVGGFRLPLDLDVSFHLLIDAYLTGVREASTKEPRSYLPRGEV
ncbi:AcrR family transcriptional regulator [Kroppenstedtia sanguinis]